MPPLLMDSQVLTALEIGEAERYAVHGLPYAFFDISLQMNILLSFHISMYDDKLLKLNYKEFIALIKHINLFHKVHFRILQLQPDTSIVNAVPISPDSYIRKGIHSGGDSGLVLSKEGCLLLLESFQKRPMMLQHIIGKIRPKPTRHLFC